MGQSRETTKISEDQRNALNAFLYRTGTESDQFMMVYASNQPSQFDGAVLDRIDETEGFSGRAISKLAIAWQAAAYGTDGAVLDKETFFRTVEEHKKSMGQKEAWLSGAK